MKDWELYLRGEEARPVGLSLFPAIEAKSLDTAKLERQRFRWLLSVFPDDPELLYNLWCQPTFLLQERKVFSNKPLQQFYNLSVALSVHLLREETRQISYLVSLKRVLSLRLVHGEPVYFLGPTSGAELEAITAAGGYPILVPYSRNSKWEKVAECRLFDSRTLFADTTAKELRRNKRRARHVVVSTWAVNPEQCFEDAQVAFTRKDGFILSAATNLLAQTEALNRDLRRVDTHQPDVGVYYQPLDLGDFYVRKQESVED